MSELGAELIAEALPKIERGELTPVMQDEKLATKCGKLSKNMGKIDFNKNAITIRNLVRGLNPWPSAYTRLDGKMLKIWSADAIDDKNVKEIAGNVEVLKNAAPGTVSFVTKEVIGVATGKGTLVLKEVQLEGKKRMLVKDFLLGNKVEIGTSFQMR